MYDIIIFPKWCSVFQPLVLINIILIYEHTKILNNKNMMVLLCWKFSSERLMLLRNNLTEDIVSCNEFRLFLPVLVQRFLYLLVSCVYVLLYPGLFHQHGQVMTLQKLHLTLTRYCMMPMLSRTEDRGQKFLGQWAFNRALSEPEFYTKSV